jgi:parallel beta-helix repeat protein
LRKLVFGTTVLLLVAGALLLRFGIQPVKSSGTIYIRADGSIDPSTANISSLDNVTYTFTGDINDSIVVERDNIILDGRDYTLQGNGSGRGIEIIGRHNVTVQTVVVENFDYGIWAHSCWNLNITGNTVTASNWMAISIHYSHSCRLDQNNATRNRHGIWLAHSFSNLASSNTATHNEWYGFYVDHYSFNNTILRNTMSNNWAGIYLAPYSENNTFSENHITQNDIGVHINRSPSNLFSHNTFANTMQIWNYGNYSSNKWDDGYPSGGNYWSDYNCTDFYTGPYQNETGSDAICDTPYLIDKNNTDNYPLMGVFSEFNATPEHDVQTICNSTISNFQFNSTAISFDVSGENDTAGFCRICIPRALMNEPFRVLVNATEVSYTLLPFSNSTYSYLYFAYSHSTQDVIIIPEFPSLVILPLFMILTLLAAITHRTHRLSTKPH